MVRRAVKPDAVAAELQGLRSKGREKAKEKEGKINLGDGAALKRALDDVAAQVALDEGHAEDFTLSNLKIGVGFFTCGLAALAHFYPRKYPDNFWVLALCVGAYVAATLALNWVLGSVEGDIFFLSRPPKGGRVLFLASRLPRYSEQYTLVLGGKRSKWSRAADGPEVKFESGITQWFDTEGTLLEADFRRAVLQHVSQFGKEHTKSS